MLEIPSLKKVYEDELCTLWLHDVYAEHGDHTLLVLHVEVVKTTERKVLDHYIDVFTSLLAQLKERGVNNLEAWVETDEQIRFAQFFGFDQFLGELTVNGQTIQPAVFRLKMEF